MTFSEEIENEIKEFANKTENIYYFPDSNYGVEYLNNNFRFLGTKIDLSKEKNYVSYDFNKKPNAIVKNIGNTTLSANKKFSIFISPFYNYISIDFSP